MPPLRERVDDLPLICDAVLDRIARDAGVWPPPRLSGEALAQLAGHGFAGNVRELENLLYRAVVLSGGEVIERADLGLGEEGGDSELQGLDPLPPSTAAAALAPAEPEPLPGDLVAHLDQVERHILVRALEKHRFNRTAAGASLGLSLRQMRYRMARLGIQGADHGAD
jgi:two-component system response regulator PilR (NtrC family)